jgi:hypothetical protein
VQKDRRCAGCSGTPRARRPNGTPASSTVGFGARYDLNDTYRLLGYVRRGIQNTNETDQYSWYASVLFTF